MPRVVPYTTRGTLASYRLTAALFLCGLVFVFTGCTRIEHPEEIAYESILTEAILESDFHEEVIRIGSPREGERVLNRINIRSPLSEKADFRLCMTVTAKDLPRHFRYGLFFGGRSDQAYHLDVTPSGTYSLSIERNNGTQRRLIRPVSSPNWKPQGTNTLAVERIGNDFFVFINGTLADRLRHSYDYGSDLGFRTLGEGEATLEAFALERIVTED